MVNSGPMFNDNRLKLGIFSANCSSGMAVTKVEERWVNSWEKQGIDWADYPRLKAWFDAVAARPAVQRGLAVLAGARKPLTDDKARQALFGSSQYQKR